MKKKGVGGNVSYIAKFHFLYIGLFCFSGKLFFSVLGFLSLTTQELNIDFKV